MSWLGGGGYNHFGLYIHGVTYTKKDGTTIDGTHMPILFESLTDPIVTGRDELGMPKLYCEIDIHRREQSYLMSASWQGFKFCSFALSSLSSVDPKTETGTIGGEADYGILVYRYVPAVGKDMKGKADAEYAVVVPHEEDAKNVPSTVHKVWKAEKAEVKWERGDWESLPTLHYITDVLAEIPIYEVVGAKVVEGTGVPDVSAARRIEWLSPNVFQLVREVFFIISGYISSTSDQFHSVAETEPFGISGNATVSTVHGFMKLISRTSSYKILLSSSHQTVLYNLKSQEVRWNENGLFVAVSHFFSIYKILTLAE
jgi:hypothetical protein